MGNNNGFVKGLLIGGIIGGAIALLYAPIQGKKLRRNISNKTEDVIDDINDYIVTGKEKAEEIIKESTELLKASKARVNNLVDSAKKIVA